MANGRKSFKERPFTNRRGEKRAVWKAPLLVGVPQYFFFAHQNDR
jgi:hypothetical protein